MPFPRASIYRVVLHWPCTEQLVPSLLQLRNLSLCCPVCLAHLIKFFYDAAPPLQDVIGHVALPGEDPVTQRAPYRIRTILLAKMAFVVLDPGESSAFTAVLLAAQVTIRNDWSASSASVEVLHHSDLVGLGRGI
jgi:hypothetical protein